MSEDTGARIVAAMDGHRFGALGVAEIAHAAQLAESTVRRWLPKLRDQRLVREVGRHG
jgi:DNA-binding IclR family transcriptional regulator